MTDANNDLIKQLDDLLDVERQALLDGDLNGLGDILEQKEELIAALNKAEFEAAEVLVPMNAKVVRNQALLEQALNGIRSVAKKLAEIRQTRKSFDTYDQRGQKNRIESEADASVEKRA